MRVAWRILFRQVRSFAQLQPCETLLLLNSVCCTRNRGIAAGHCVRATDQGAGAVHWDGAADARLGVSQEAIRVALARLEAQAEGA